MIKNKSKKILFTFMTFSVVFSNQNILPDKFVYLDDFIPNVYIELRYNSNFNFLEKNVYTYFY